MAFVLKSRIYAKSNGAGFARNLRAEFFNFFFHVAHALCLKARLQHASEAPLENMKLSSDLLQRDDVASP